MITVNTLIKIIQHAQVHFKNIYIFKSENDMIMSDFENLYHMYFFACLIKNQQEKTQDQKKTFNMF